MSPAPGGNAVSATGSLSTFNWAEMKMPSVLPSPRASRNLAADAVLSHVISKAEKYSSGDVILLCHRPTVFAYFSGRSDPMTFETHWPGVCFVAERSCISVHSNRAVIVALSITELDSHLPHLFAEIPFSVRNPQLDNRAILLKLR